MTSSRPADSSTKVIHSWRSQLNAPPWATTVSTPVEDALTQIRKQVPDVVLLHLVMPEMSGLEVCRSIREFSSVQSCGANRTFAFGTQSSENSSYTSQQLTKQMSALSKKIERGVR